MAFGDIDDDWDYEQKPFSMNYALCDAARTGDVETGKHLLKTYPIIIYINHCEPGQDTALMVAARWGHEAFCDWLLSAGASADVVDDKDKTALIVAIESQQPAIALKLVEKTTQLDAQISDTLNFKFTALMLAINVGMEDVALALINKGANLNLQNGDNKTALMFALENGRDKVAQALIEKNADLTLIDKFEGNALHYAAQYGNETLCQTLIDKGLPVDSRDGFQNTPLIRAALRGKTEACITLLKNHANLEAKNKVGRTALMAAAGHVAGLDICTALLKQDADAFVIDNEGRSLLHEAVSSNSRQKLALFLEAGLDVNLPEATNGKTPLIAAARGSIDHRLCRMLLEHGAYVDATDFNGKTALSSIRIMQQGLHIVDIAEIKKKQRLLLQYGATMPENSPELENLLAEMKQTARAAFPPGSAITKTRCFADDGLLSDALLDACATGQFTELVAAPLIASRKPEDHALFKQIWQQLPERWRTQEAATHLQFCARSNHPRINHTPPSAGRN
jgi:ankyrin repeat protein